MGLASVGLGKAVSGAGWRPGAYIAGSCGAAVLATAMILLAMSPVGQVPTSQLNYDPTHWTEKAHAFAAGALATASLRYLWPAAVANKPHKVALGTTMGAAVTCGAWFLNSALCWATPFCL